MTDQASVLPQNKESAILNRRSWVVLPLLSLLTIAFLAIAVEAMARRLFPEPTSTALTCLILNDPSTGVRAIPNTKCVDKLYESPSVEYVYNNCGHRAGMPCAPKAAGTFRIVLVGSSFAEGLYVPREKTFAALAPAELSKKLGRKVELYNEGMQWGTPHSVDLRFKEVLAANPDLILWTLTPFDIENVSLTIPYVAKLKEMAKTDQRAGSRGAAQRIIFALTHQSITKAIGNAWQRVLEAFGQTRTSFLLEHCLYKSQSHYLKHFLMQQSGTEFLRPHPGALWLNNLEQFSGYDADMETKAKTAGIPMVVVLLPNRAQAAMISLGEWPDGFDPYKLNNDLRSIVESHGGIYIDILHGFRTIPNPEQHFYPVDGHIDPDAHAIVAGLLTDALTAGTVPLVAPSLPPQKLVETRR